MKEAMPNRECVRCGAPVYWRDPHLCKDLEYRSKRRGKQVEAVMKILQESCLEGTDHAQEIAMKIVQKLSEMGVAQD